MGDSNNNVGHFWTVTNFPAYQFMFVLLGFLWNSRYQRLRIVVIESVKRERRVKTFFDRLCVLYPFVCFVCATRYLFGRPLSISSPHISTWISLMTFFSSIICKVLCDIPYIIADFGLDFSPIHVKWMCTTPHHDEKNKAKLHQQQEKKSNWAKLFKL